MKKITDSIKAVALYGVFLLGLGYAALVYIKKIAKESGKFGK